MRRRAVRPEHGSPSAAAAGGQVLARDLVLGWPPFPGPIPHEAPAPSTTVCPQKGAPRRGAWDPREERWVGPAASPGPWETEGAQPPLGSPDCSERAQTRSDALILQVCEASRSETTPLQACGSRVWEDGAR